MCLKNCIWEFQLHARPSWGIFHLFIYLFMRAKSKWIPLGLYPSGFPNYLNSCGKPAQLLISSCFNKKLKNQQKSYGKISKYFVTNFSSEIFVLKNKQAERETCQLPSRVATLDHLSFNHCYKFKDSESRQFSNLIQ